MDVFKSLLPYIASVGAIAVGLLSVTATPIFTLDRDLAVALIVGGFGTTGVSVVIPNVVRTARLEGEVRGEARAVARGAVRRP